MSDQAMIYDAFKEYPITSTNQPTVTVTNPPFEANYDRKLFLWPLKFVSRPIDTAISTKPATFTSTPGPYIILSGASFTKRSTPIDTKDPKIGYFKMSHGHRLVQKVCGPHLIPGLMKTPSLVNREAELTGDELTKYRTSELGYKVPQIMNQNSFQIRSFKNEIVNSIPLYEGQSLFRIVMRVIKDHPLHKVHNELQYSAYTVNHLMFIYPMQDHIALPLLKARSPNFLKSFNFYTEVNKEKKLIHENSTVGEMEEAKQLYLNSSDFRNQTNGGPREMRLLIESYFGFLSFVVFDSVTGEKTVHESPQVTEGYQRPTIEIALQYYAKDNYYNLIQYNVTFDGKPHRYNFWNHRHCELKNEVQARHTRISEYIVSLHSKEKLLQLQQDMFDLSAPDQSSPTIEHELPAFLDIAQWHEHNLISREEIVTKARSIKSSSALQCHRPLDCIDSLMLEVTDHQSFYRIISKVLNKRVPNYSYDKSTNRVKDISEHIAGVLKEADYHTNLLENIELKIDDVDGYLKTDDFLEQRNAGRTELQLLTKYWDGVLRIVIFDSVTGEYTSYPPANNKIVPLYEVALRCDDTKRLYQLISYTIDFDGELQDQPVWEYSEQELPGETENRFDYIKQFIVNCNQHDTSSTSMEDVSDQSVTIIPGPANMQEQTVNVNEMTHCLTTKNSTCHHDDDVEIMEDVDPTLRGGCLTAHSEDKFLSQSGVKTPSPVVFGENQSKPTPSSPNQSESDNMIIDRTNTLFLPNTQTNLTIDSPLINIPSAAISPTPLNHDIVCGNGSGDRMLPPLDTTPPKSKQNQESDLDQHKMTDDDASAPWINTQDAYSDDEEFSDPKELSLLEIPITGKSLPPYLNGKTPQQMMKEFHYCVFTPEYLKLVQTAKDEPVAAWHLTHSLVDEGKKLHQLPDPDSKTRSEISGGVTQRPIPDLLNATIGTGGEEQVNWDCTALKTEQELGKILLKVTALGEWNMQPRFPKLLTVESGKGEQTLHADTTRGWEYLHDSNKEFRNDPIVSMILYCTDTKSTRLPTYPHADAQFSRIDNQDLNKIDIQHFLPESYLSFPVESGTIVLFKHDVIHGGPRNESKEDRIVWFDTFTQKVPTIKSPARNIDEYVLWIFFQMWYIFDDHVDHPNYLRWAKHYQDQIDNWVKARKGKIPKDPFLWEPKQLKDSTMTYVGVRKSSPSRTSSTSSNIDGQFRSMSRISSSRGPGPGVIEYLKAQTNMLCIQTDGREPFSPLHPGELIMIKNSKGQPHQPLCPDMPLCIVWVQVVEYFNKTTEDPSIDQDQRVSPLLPYWLPPFDENSQHPPCVLGLTRAAVTCTDSKCTEGNHKVCIFKEKFFTEIHNKKISQAQGIEGNLEKYTCKLNETESIQVCRWDSIMTGMKELRSWPTTSNRLSGVIKTCWSSRSPLATSVAEAATAATAATVVTVAVSSSHPSVYRVLYSNDDPKLAVSKDILRPLIPAPSYLISGVNSPLYDCTPAAWFPFNEEKPAGRRFATAYHQRLINKGEKEPLSGPVHIGSVIEFTLDSVVKYGIVLLTHVRLHTVTTDRPSECQQLNRMALERPNIIPVVSYMKPVAYLNVWEISGSPGNFTVPPAPDSGDPHYFALLHTIRMSHVVEIIDTNVAFPSSHTNTASAATSSSSAPPATTEYRLNRLGFNKQWFSDTQSNSHTGMMNRLNDANVWSPLYKWFDECDDTNDTAIGHNIYEHAAGSFNIKSAIDLLRLSPLHQSSQFFNGNAPAPELRQGGRTRHPREVKHLGDEKRRKQVTTHSDNYPLSGTNTVIDNLPEGSQTYIRTRDPVKTDESLKKNCTALQVSIIPAAEDRDISSAMTDVETVAVDSSSSKNARHSRHSALKKAEAAMIAAQQLKSQEDQVKRQQKQNDDETNRRDQARVAEDQKKKEMKLKAKAEQKQAQRKQKKEEVEKASRIAKEKQDEAERMSNKSKKNTTKVNEIKKRKRGANSDRDHDDSDQDVDAMEDVEEKKEEKTKELPQAKRQKLHGRNTRANPKLQADNEVQEDIESLTPKQRQTKKSRCAPPNRQDSKASAVDALDKMKNDAAGINTGKLNDSPIPLAILRFLCTSGMYWTLASIPSTKCAVPPLLRFFHQNRQNFNTVTLKIQQQYTVFLPFLTVSNKSVQQILKFSTQESEDMVVFKHHCSLLIDLLRTVHAMHSPDTPFEFVDPSEQKVLDTMSAAAAATAGGQHVLEQNGFQTPSSNRTSAPTPLLTPITTTTELYQSFDAAAAAAAGTVPGSNHVQPLTTDMRQPLSTPQSPNPLQSESDNKTHQLLKQITELLQQNQGTSKELLQQNMELHKSSQLLAHDQHQQAQFNTHQLSTQISQQFAFVTQQLQLQPHSMQADFIDSKGQQQPAQGYSVASAAPMQAQVLSSQRPQSILGLGILARQSMSQQCPYAQIATAAISFPQPPQQQHLAQQPQQQPPQQSFAPTQFSPVR